MARVVTCAAMLGGCGAAPELDEENLGSESQDIAFGIQGFARFNKLGTAVAGTVATTIATAVDAVHTGIGRYRVTFHSLAATVPSAAGQGGTLQVVAVGSGNARCTLASGWTYTAAHDVIGEVICSRPEGVKPGRPVNSGFSAYYGRGPASSGSSAYARVDPNGNVPSDTSWSSSGAAITATKFATGGYWVFIDAGEPQQVQVTAIHKSSHCHPSFREDGITTVACYNSAGALSDTAFTIHQAGSDGIGLAGRGAFTQVSSTGAIASAYDFNSCPGAANTASHIGVGRYELTHPLVGESLGNFQLSAHGTFTGYCKIAKSRKLGSTATVTAQCYDDTGTPKDMPVTESYSVFLGACGP